MKKVILCMIAAAMVAAMFFACSKESSKLNEHVSAIEEPDVSLLVQNFTQRMHEHKTGISLKSEESISIDSAIWYIDATLNFTYANGNHPFARLHWDTVFIQMDVLNSFEAMYQQVFESYDASLDGLAERYHAITGENKQFMMALVEDMGALPGNKRNLRIITVTGTGTLEHSGEFGELEAYRFEHFAEHDCFGNDTLGAPKIFEALLYQHFNSPPTNNCRWYFYGAKDSLVVNYWDHPLNSTFMNYLDYKIFAASQAVAPIDDLTECLEYNYNNSGIHEMQFYYDHKKDFINAWVSSSQNTGNLKFAGSLIKSEDEYFEYLRYIWHVPTFYFRKRCLECSVPITLPER